MAIKYKQKKKPAYRKGYADGTVDTTQSWGDPNQQPANPITDFKEPGAINIDSVRNASKTTQLDMNLAKKDQVLAQLTSLISKGQGNSPEAKAIYDNNKTLLYQYASNDPDYTKVVKPHYESQPVAPQPTQMVSSAAQLPAQAPISQPTPTLLKGIAPKPILQANQPNIQIPASQSMATPQAIQPQTQYTSQYAMGPNAGPQQTAGMGPSTSPTTPTPSESANSFTPAEVKPSEPSTVSTPISLPFDRYNRSYGPTDADRQADVDNSVRMFRASQGQEPISNQPPAQQTDQPEVIGGPETPTPVVKGIAPKPIATPPSKKTPTPTVISVGHDANGGEYYILDNNQFIPAEQGATYVEKGLINVAGPKNIKQPFMGTKILDSQKMEGYKYNEQAVNSNKINHLAEVSQQLHLTPNAIRRLAASYGISDQPEVDKIIGPATEEQQRSSFLKGIVGPIKNKKGPLDVEAQQNNQNMIANNLQGPPQQEYGEPTYSPYEQAMINTGNLASANFPMSDVRKYAELASEKSMEAQERPGRAESLTPGGDVANQISGLKDMIKKDPHLLNLAQQYGEGKISEKDLANLMPSYNKSTGPMRLAFTEVAQESNPSFSPTTGGSTLDFPTQLKNAKDLITNDPDLMHIATLYSNGMISEQEMNQKIPGFNKAAGPMRLAFEELAVNINPNFNPLQYGTRRKSEQSAGAQDAKIQQQKVASANSLQVLLQTVKNPQTGEFDETKMNNITPQFATELAMGCAKLISPNGVVSEGLTQELSQGTVDEIIARTLGYVGLQHAGTTLQNIKNIQHFVEREGTLAQKQRDIEFSGEPGRLQYNEQNPGEIGPGSYTNKSTGTGSGNPIKPSGIKPKIKKGNVSSQGQTKTKIINGKTVTFTKGSDGLWHPQ